MYIYVLTSSEAIKFHVMLECADDIDLNTSRAVQHSPLYCVVVVHLGHLKAFLCFDKYTCCALNLLTCW